MPLYQPGQVVPGQSGAPKLYGADKQKPNVPFQQKLMDRFKAQEFVTIRNIDDEPLYWQFLPLDAETETFDETGLMKQIYRDRPEMWYIPPGETDVIVGASAYRALDVLYKQIAAKKTTRLFRDPNSPQYDEKGQHQPKNFNFSDDSLQEEVIEQAYLGKATPAFGPVPVAEVNKTTQPQVTPTTPQPNNDTQIPVPASAPNGQPAPEVDTGAAISQPTPTGVIDPNLIPEPAPAVYAQPDLEPAKELASAGQKRK